MGNRQLAIWKWNNILATNSRYRVTWIASIISFLLLYSNISSAQYSFSRWNSIPVIINGDTIKYPWAGGFNNPQFSDIDLNGDGIMDLLVFDRSGNRVIPFINGGTPNQVDYKYAPEYQSKFPDLYSWALLVDYNNDGKKDIYTSTEKKGIKVYRNEYTIADGLKFTLADSLLFADGALLYVSEWDIPALKDMDSDGDIDILTFNFAGSLMEYYKNLSIENYGNSDSLKYTLEANCWGTFEESWGGCSVALDTCGPGKMSGERHAGSTTLALDLDCDNDMEVIIGDITCTQAYMLTNGGDSITASIVSVDPLYPINYPIDISRFPSAFYVDVNNDGTRDILAAPNALFISENYTCSWYYKNTNTDCTPNFSFQTNAFLQDGMIDEGEGANPVFFDYNGDSLLDLVIGNYGYYSINPPYLSGLSLYKNVGTATTPVFELVTKDFANINSYGLLGIYPAFGDLDGDGDEDMILGESEGNLFYFNNNAAGSNPANFVLSQANYKAIDVGQFSAPQLVDVNCDGLLDLLIGERSGNLNFYENNGTDSLPEFSLVSNTFGSVDVKGSDDLTGYSSPFLSVFDSTGGYTLLVGSERGYIYRYTDIQNNLNGNFSLSDSIYFGRMEGERTSISGGDLNHDGTIDIAVGNYDGGISLFLNSGSPPPPKICPPYSPPPLLPFSSSIFPNPVKDNLHVNILGTKVGDIAELTVYNIVGQKILSEKFNENLESITIDLGNYSGGIYFCKLKIISEQALSNNSAMLKFVVVK